MTRLASPLPVLRAATAAIAIGVLSSMTLVTVSQPATAQSVQKIAVLVNDSAISEHDIQQRGKLIRLTGGGGGNMRQRAIEELIEETLKLQEAKRMGISASEDDVNRRLSTIAQRVGAGSLSVLRQGLRQQGVDISTLAARFRADIAWQQVVRRTFQQTVQIREADIIAAIRDKGEKPEEQKATEFDLTAVIVVVPRNASNALVSQRKRDADRIRSNISSCSNVRRVASAFRDVTVRDIGRRTDQDLPQELSQELLQLAVGRTSIPARNEQGYEMVVVCDKKEVTGLQAARNPMELELRNKQGLIVSRRLLRDLRADALIDYR